MYVHTYVSLFINLYEIIFRKLKRKENCKITKGCLIWNVLRFQCRIIMKHVFQEFFNKEYETTKKTKQNSTLNFSQPLNWLENIIRYTNLNIRLKVKKTCSLNSTLKDIWKCQKYGISHCSNNYTSVQNCVYSSNK